MIERRFSNYDNCILKYIQHTPITTSRVISHAVELLKEGNISYRFIELDPKYLNMYMLDNAPHAKKWLCGK